jgi:hypothetical protein
MAMTEFKPTSPAEDLVAWASRLKGGAQGLLTPDLVALVQGGVAISMGRCDGRGWPIVGWGTGCRVLHGRRLRVLCSRSGNLALVQSLEENRPLAVTFTATRDHRACQVKTRRADVLTAVSDDLPELDRQTAVLQAGLIELGLPVKVARDYCTFDPDDLVAVEFDPEHLFSQTPGPGAGVELT